MTEYGRIHTDGSRSGGQPTQRSMVVAATGTDRIGGAGVVTHGVVGVDTQSDAVREAVEKERAAIVAWLLECMELYISRGLDTYVALEDIAHNIERGEHHGAPPE